MTNNFRGQSIAEALRYLYRAWLDWASGCVLARDRRKVGLLIDVFDDAVEAAGLLVGADLESMRRGDETTPSVARRILQTAGGRQIFSHGAQQLVGRMES